jgi:hypothetical protein
VKKYKKEKLFQVENKFTGEVMMVALKHYCQELCERLNAIARSKTFFYTKAESINGHNEYDLYLPKECSKPQFSDNIKQRVQDYLKKFKTFD